MSAPDTALIELLADGKFHSGEALGDMLGLSRMAINKRIDRLTELGLDIFRVSGKGYRLAEPLQLLEEQRVRAHLSSQCAELPLYFHRITPSTNDDLRELLNAESPLVPGTAVLAEMQTAGRGRRGKAWISPFGTNLYLSMHWPLYAGLNAAMGMSVALGIGIARMLEAQGIKDVQVKWPNDIYIASQKVAGILVELEGQAGGEGHAIVGVGMNLAMPAREQSLIDQPFTDIQRHLDQPLERNFWAAKLVESCYLALSEHDEHGLKPMVASWARYDRYYNQPVKVQLGQHEQFGIAKGIDEMGALVVEQEDGVKRYFGGEVSVRSRS
ncbi:MAG: bifunctional biotin--[acetyl-CoA-carboxylase] ligase/biotin operon repressor BirA [Idiomarina sp.]|nr:bifunctional biotin--[acetyl-CoA-carboxylase] ligase/biotin operon repressor BirA [Idiomarina sp.]